MHASQRLRESHFSVQIESGSASVADLLPEWTITDRVGVVVHEPLGALGASLLIQAAISRFYAFDPQRRDHAAQYPPIFMFHVGGRFGDHSPMDFWPPRREVFFDDPDNPYEVLGALRDRGITRLLVPEGVATGLDYAYAAPSGWTDIHSAREQTASAFVYSASGRVGGHDVQLSTGEKQVESMVTDVLRVEAMIEQFERSSDQDLLDLELGPSTPADLHGWMRMFVARSGEVPAAYRRSIEAARKEKVARGDFTQTYRRVSVDEALGLLVPAEHSTGIPAASVKQPAHA
ncbi:TPA: hypothetical protein SLW10_006442 [Pseudomonas aeruginosa]|nr:hypothetical protein [Pseudomonas aeruginosa]